MPKILVVSSEKKVRIVLAVLERVASLQGVSVDELGRLRNATVPLGRAASADECAGAI